MTTAPTESSTSTTSALPLEDRFPVGLTIEREADRPPFLFVSKGTGTLRYRIVMRGDVPKLACFKESHGVAAEINHTPRYKVGSSGMLVDGDDVPLDLHQLRDDPFYARPSVRVCQVVGNKVIVE
jgi:hypothetical protein